MRGSRLVLRVLEGACAAIVALGMLYATLLAFAADREALWIFFRRGAFTPSIVVFAGACVGWLCLRRTRSRMHSPVVPAIGAACAVGLVALMWWTTHDTAEVQHIRPSPPGGQLHQSPPPDNTPGTAQPPAPPSAGQ